MQTRTRWNFTLVMILIVGLIISTTIQQMQLGVEALMTTNFEGNYNYLSAPRGVIYDRNGEVLVSNVNKYQLIAINNTKNRTWLQANRPEVKLPNVENTAYIQLGTGMDLLSAQLQIQALSPISPQLIPIQTRNYLVPEAFAHIIGYTGLTNETDLQNGYQATDYIGKYGLEQILENELKGIKGTSSNYDINPVPGQSAVLSIDAKWQRSLYYFLNKQVGAVNATAGAAAIIDADTGFLQAYVSAPSFDPNFFLQGNLDKINEISQNPKTPLVDKMRYLLAAPGSTFKVIAGLDLVEQSIINADTTFMSPGCMSIGGHPLCEFGKRRLGLLDITTALARSSNTFFCTYLLQQTSEGKLANYFNLVQSMGIGQSTGFILGDNKGSLPSPESRKKTGQGWFSGDTCNVGIGQGELLVTPLQMMMVAAVIANGGHYLEPQLVLKLVNSENETIKEFSPKVIREIPLSENSLTLVRQGMDKAVSDPSGTGYRVLHDLPIGLSAKTGTAEAAIYEGGIFRFANHGWAIGYFQHNNRSYAFVIHLNFVAGEWLATPVLRNFIRCLGNNFVGDCGV